MDKEQRGYAFLILSALMGIASDLRDGDIIIWGLAIFLFVFGMFNFLIWLSEDYEIKKRKKR